MLIVRILIVQQILQEVTFTVNPSDVAGDLSSTNPAQLYIKANSRPYEYYQTLTSNGPFTVTNITQADTYQYIISVNNTTTCEIANGTFTVEEKNNEQLILDLEVIQPDVETVKVKFH